MTYSHREDRRLRPRRRGWLSLLPLPLLAVLTMGIGWYTEDFSKVPMTIVFLLTALLSLFTLRGYSVHERVAVFSRGAGSTDLLLMVWIFVLAGAFAKSAQTMGAVGATVDLTLMYLPDNILLAGLFVAACVVSLCVGTSVGTIVALVPVATELAVRVGEPLPLMVAAVVGGSFFGDNLSFISDTTVAATKTQQCNMRDKFRANFKIVLPAALLCFIIYVVIGVGMSGVAVQTAAPTLHLWRVLPYAVVLLAALMGVNVLLVLLFGILLTGVVGCAEGSYDLAGWLQALAAGVSSMGDLILISMIAGGLLAVVRKGGGITLLVRGLTRRVHTRRQAECCISALVSLTNCCTANNTVAILSVGSIARDISKRYGVSRTRSASLLDMYSCVIQGILPYGAQLLMAGGLAMVSPLSIIPHLYYPMLLAVSGGVSILLSKDRPVRKRHSETLKEKSSVGGPK